MRIYASTHLTIYFSTHPFSYISNYLYTFLYLYSPIHHHCRLALYPIGDPGPKNQPDSRRIKHEEITYWRTFRAWSGIYQSKTYSGILHPSSLSWKDCWKKSIWRTCAVRNFGGTLHCMHVMSVCILIFRIELSVALPWSTSLCMALSWTEPYCHEMCYADSTVLYYRSKRTVHHNTAQLISVLA